MSRSLTGHLAVLALSAIGLAACGPKSETASADRAQAADAKAVDPAAAAAAKEKEGLEAGAEAVAYGFPVVIMDITCRKLTNVAKAGAMAAPVNQFANMPTFPDASFKDVVRANVDTLYSSACLDLSKEPLVMSLPDTSGRYYLMPMLDAWTNVFASPGKRTTGTKAGHFAITGPGWSGELPKGVQELKSPTNLVWIIGRVQTNGPKDYAAVHAIQKQFTLAPLSIFDKPYTPPVGTVDPAFDMKTPPVEQVARMSTSEFFNALARLMRENPPPAADAPVIARLAKLGIVAGEKFDISRLDPAVAKGLEKAVPTALERLRAASKTSGAPVNGWRIPPMELGDYGTEYGLRAVVALVGLGANLAADAVYPSVFVDSEDGPLSGANRYVVHFDKGQEPPVQAFWSITMYDPQSFFVANKINRFAVSSWMPFKRNADGSLDLYIQKDSPGKDRETNWLPAPDGDFNMTLRMYWPTEKPPSVIDSSWKPAGVKLVKS
ncbi:MAG TPA: DUF1254 domain-containing protein [Burkholderiaceae bacterium]|nr:DUF1254 domain-containing protein [Burkholderiaceae bacterium]